MKEIQFFVNSWIFGNVTIKEVIERVSKLGYNGIELVGEPDIYNPDEINKLIKNEGLKICSICGMHPGPGKDDLRALCHYEKKERDKAVDYIRKCVDLACECNARSVLIVPSLVGRPQYFKSKEDDIKYATDAISKAGEYAENKKIILTIEPINRYEVGLINSIDEAITMAKKINNKYVRIMGDTFHMQIEEWDGIPDAIRRAGKYWIQHLHCADNTREAPGKGTMPWREIIRALYDIDYEGVMSLEPLPKGASPYDAREGKIPKEKLDSGLKFALEYLKQQENIVKIYLNK